jgi:predicted ATPase/DNA-binding SARP family transcriptional activator
VRRAAARLATLPHALTRLVGREQQVDEVQALVTQHRLVTLTGVGGSGKTRLALEVAHRSDPSFAHGARWIELAALTDGETLGEQVATALGVSLEGSRHAIDALATAFASEQLLLVLDNCEHLVVACSAFAQALLQRCPHVHILATSRESLGVAGERSWLVPTLALPAPDDEDVLAQAMTAPAVQLFEERARDVVPRFRVDASNVHAVVRVCRRVDGLPLAIELAAARIRVLPPEQLADRLEHDLRALGSAARGAPSRQRTLYAAIEWSYQLLDDAERRLLDRLSVFAGDWPLEAAEVVCADALLAEHAVLDLLSALVDKSLVTMREQDGAARYRLLETIRAFAAEQLALRGEERDARLRHAQYCVALVASAEPDFTTPQRPRAIATVAGAMDDIRAALHRTREEAPALHLELASMLTWVWYSLGQWTEGRRWLEHALELPGAERPTRERAKALFGAGAFASLQADPEHALRWLMESLAIATQVGDERLAAYVHNYLGMTYNQQARTEGDVHVEAALAWFAGHRDRYGQRLALLLRATLRLAQGNLEAAERDSADAVRIARDFGLERELGISLQVLGGVLLQRGDTAEADRLIRESLSALRRDPQLLFLGRGLDMLGLIAAQRGSLTEAARFFGGAQAERARIGAGLWRLDQERLAPHVARVREALGVEAFEAAWQDGAQRRLDLVNDTVVTPAPSLPASDNRLSAATEEPVVTGLDVRALGPLEIRVHGVLLSSQQWQYARPRELLLYLLLHPDGRTREQIGAVFWPDASVAQVKNNFHVTLHHVRRVLGHPEWITFAEGRYAVADAAQAFVDAREFESVVETALRRARRARPGEAPLDVAALEAALALYRGDLLDDAEAGDWHLAWRDRLGRLWRDGMLLLGRTLGAANDPRAAAVFRAMVDRDPLHEEASRHLMQRLVADGRRLDALQEYDRLARSLSSELGVEPEAETRQLHQSLRGGAR